MSIIIKLKSRAKRLKRQLNVIYYAYQDPGIGLLPKIISAFTIGYALSPIDLIPDFIPVIGYLDDLIIVPLLIAFVIRLIPHDVFEDAMKKAENEPVVFKKNWIFAILFILIWITLLSAMCISIVRIIFKT